MCGEKTPQGHFRSAEIVVYDEFAEPVAEEEPAEAPETSMAIAFKNVGQSDPAPADPEPAMPSVLSPEIRNLTLWEIVQLRGRAS